MTVHLDPDLAKHRTGREIMQRLEETFGAAGSEGPAVELSHRLPLWPLRSVTWSRQVHGREGDASQQASQQSSQNGAASESVLYTAVCFKVSRLLLDDSVPHCTDFGLSQWEIWQPGRYHQHFMIVDIEGNAELSKLPDIPLLCHDSDRLLPCRQRNLWSTLSRTDSCR